RLVIDLVVASTRGANQTGEVRRQGVSVGGAGSIRTDSPTGGPSLRRSSARPAATGSMTGVESRASVPTAPLPSLVPLNWGAVSPTARRRVLMASEDRQSIPPWGSGGQVQPRQSVFAGPNLKNCTDE